MCEDVRSEFHSGDLPFLIGKAAGPKITEPRELQYRTQTETEDVTKRVHVDQKI